MSISKRRLSDGTTVYDVREYVGFTLDGKRDRKSVTCRTLRAAKAEQAKLIAMRDSRRGRSGRCTFADYVDRWWWPSTASLAASTRDTYEREVRLRLRPAFGGTDMRDITRPMVQRMVDGCGTKKVAEKALGVLGTILRQAMGDGLVDRNVAAARYSMPPDGRKRDNGLVLTTFGAMSPLVSALRRYAEVDDGFCLRLALLGLLMGMRPEERYGLDWEDVDLAGHVCHIHQAYLMVSRREGVHDLKEPKTELSRRDVPMPDDVADALRYAPGAHSGPVLVGAGGGRVSPSTARHRWSRFLGWCDAEGIDVPHVTIENQRHSFATSYLHAGGRVEDLSRILGHADIVTTYRRYVRPGYEDAARGVGGIVPRV